ncbi:MAG: SprT-like domain-containing protein [Candidatus Acidiferrum sp.]
MTPAKRLKLMRRESFSVPGGAPLFQRVFTRIGCDGRPPRFRVEFYPYASLVLTIRRREEVVYVRFSDLLRRAPLVVLEGAAALLLSRVYRRKAPRSLVEPYLNYARSDRTRSRVSSMRRGRVRLASTGPRGRHFDLEKMFEQLNETYFAGSLELPHIGWSTRSWRRQFGCYDPGPNQILLNRRMDHPGIPQVAVEYVLYHEMLHVKHPTRSSGCSLVSHSPEFRAEEKLFADFARARRILDHLAR